MDTKQLVGTMPTGQRTDYPIQIGRYIQFHDVSETPIVSPIANGDTPITLTVPENAIALKIKNDGNGNIRISTENDESGGYMLLKNSEAEIFPCANVAKFYIHYAAAASVSFSFECI